LLRRFGERAFATEDPPNSNLIRKQFHTKLLELAREKEAMNFMSIIDGHSEAVARKVRLFSKLSGRG
jgi:hypothetical protein